MKTLENCVTNQQEKQTTSYRSQNRTTQVQAPPRIPLEERHEKLALKVQKDKTKDLYRCLKYEMKSSYHIVTL